ncbi:MAG TPA: glycogen synthase GlgA [Planctomycetota bacterium]|nr:glycogen synthase GlgA [Planctomycetota bacterium]
MNIAFVASEVVPYSKTGGLADVAGALPAEIEALGHKVTVYTPYYRSTKKVDPKARVVAEGSVPVGASSVPWTLHQSSAPKSGVKTYFIGCDAFFDRDGLYGTAQGDYEDSCSRFVLFCRATLAAAQALGERVNIWHCHDWQTALIPVYLKHTFKGHPFHAGAATVFTIHNLAYQGLFWHWDWPLLNLPWQHFNWKEMEFHGKMNLLKGALVHSDMLATVSPTYAQEIQTAEFGCGLEGVLSDRKRDLVGIVNGIDTRTWNPSSDALLPAVYNIENLDGKKTCKEVLRKKLNLPNDSTAVVGMIGRLFEQKGFDLVAQSIEELLRRDIQLVILGTGREEYHKLLQRVQQANPQKVAVAFAFDNALAHLIEAGSDIFLMPSRYEPCGLNQLYSLAYGTPPVVRKVGGLADTITDTTSQSLANGTATGFQFREYSAAAMIDCLDRALRVFKTEPEKWRQIQQNGMRQDWSWRKSAEKYVELYKRVNNA